MRPTARGARRCSRRWSGRTAAGAARRRGAMPRSVGSSRWPRPRRSLAIWFAVPNRAPVQLSDGGVEATIRCASRPRRRRLPRPDLRHARRLARCATTNSQAEEGGGERRRLRRVERRARTESCRAARKARRAGCARCANALSQRRRQHWRRLTRLPSAAPPCAAARRAAGRLPARRGGRPRRRGYRRFAHAHGGRDRVVEPGDAFPSAARRQRAALRRRRRDVAHRSDRRDAKR